jgi:hypothetical protein
MPTARVPGVIRPRSAAAEEDVADDAGDDALDNACEDDAPEEEASLEDADDDAPEEEASLEDADDDASLGDAAELDAALDVAALEAAAELPGVVELLLPHAVRTAAQAASAATATRRRTARGETRLFTVVPFRGGGCRWK